MGAESSGRVMEKEEGRRPGLGQGDGGRQGPPLCARCATLHSTASTSGSGRCPVFVPLSVLEFRDRAATYFGDKVVVIDGDTALTYRAWAGRTHRLANALVDLGVEPGDRVSFITYNTHHLLESPGRPASP
jgi:hypothetical protein